MSEIKVDVILPESSSVDVKSPTQDLSANLIVSNPNVVDITSPTQALAANVIIPGPEGPRGDKGDKGDKGETGFVNTGDLDLRYYSILNPSGFITGVDLSNYASLNQLQLTGSNLQSQINNLDNTYATDIDLASTGSNLTNKLNNLSGYINNQDNTISNNLNLTGQTLQNNINVVSSNLSTTGNTLNININSLSGLLVDTYYLKSNPSGFITGIDLSNYVTRLNGQFINRPFVNGTGIILSGEIVQIDLSPFVQLTGNQTISGIKTFDVFPIISGNKFITGVDLSSYLTSTNAANIYATINSLSLTGSNLQNQINNLNTNLSNNLTSTGSTLNTKINTISGYFESENTIGFSYSLSAGNDTFYVQYPYILSSNPRSISCIFQNQLNNMIYYPSISNIDKTGFYVNLSDIVSENGYYLNINIKK